MNRPIRKKIVSGLLTLTTALIIYGCYPGGAEYVSDQDLTATEYSLDYYDPSSNLNKFNQFKTYYMSDTVDFESNDDEAELSPDEEVALINAFEDQFSARGYLRITDTTSIDAPDFAVTLVVVSVKTTGGTWVPPPYPPGWGGWWPGWGWGPGYGWGGTYVPYQYTTGTVSAHLSVPKDAVGQGGDITVPIGWRSIFNGLVSSSQGNNTSRIDNSIQQAFIQSPYLESKK